MPNAHKTKAALRDFLDMLDDGTYLNVDQDGASRPLIEIGTGAPTGTGNATRGMIYIRRDATAANAAVYIGAGTSSYTSVI